MPKLTKKSLIVTVVIILGLGIGIINNSSFGLMGMGNFIKQPPKTAVNENASPQEDPGQVSNRPQSNAPGSKNQDPHGTLKEDNQNSHGKDSEGTDNKGTEQNPVTNAETDQYLISKVLGFLEKGKVIKNAHAIEGYSDKISYYAGETVELKVHSPKKFFSFDVIRFGKDQQVVLQEKNKQGSSQDYTEDAYARGAQWDTTCSFVIPSSWSSGMYAAKLYDDTGNSFYITFINKGKKEELEGDIAVIASTNTWAAYNEWGGASLYAYNIKDKSGKEKSDIVHLQRPNPSAKPIGNEGNLARGERHILGWLENQGHSYKLIADRDLISEPEILNNFKTIVLTTHSEYWTESMYDTLVKYMDNGGNMLYLSGNGVYWKTVIKGNILEVCKTYETHKLNGTPGGRWSLQLKRNETSVLGVRYQNTGFSVPAPYKVEKEDHWVFAGTNLKKGALIGKKGLNTARGSTGGASGWETDQVDEFTPKNYVLLAKGTNTEGAGADMIYYDHKGGGGVFAAGSITFGGSLAIDPDLTKMVNNVIKRFNQ